MMTIYLVWHPEMSMKVAFNTRSEAEEYRAKNELTDYNISEVEYVYGHLVYDDNERGRIE